MALFRDINGQFYDFPQDVLDKHVVKKESMDQDFRKQHVSGVQIPRPQSPSVCCDPAGANPSTVIVHQYFGVAGPMGQFVQDTLPSDIQLAHYGTTVDNPKE